MLKKISLLIAIIVLLFACGGDSEGGENGGSSTDDFDRQVMLAHLADDIIIPAFEDFETQITSLKTATENFTASPDATSLATLQTAWFNAYKTWQYVEMFNIGKAEELLYTNYMNIYPVNTSEIESNIANGGYDLEHVNNIDTQGFPALDYLLHGTKLRVQRKIIIKLEGDSVSFLNDDSDTIYYSDTGNQVYFYNDGVSYFYDSTEEKIYYTENDIRIYLYDEEGSPIRLYDDNNNLSYTNNLLFWYDEQGNPVYFYDDNEEPIYLYIPANNTTETLAKFTTDANATGYKSYLTDVVARMNDLTSTIVADWNGTYRDEFVASYGNTATSSLNKLVNDFIYYYEKGLRANKIGIPGGVFSTEALPEKVEAYYNQEISKELALEALNAVEDFFNGKHYNGATQELGFKAYLEYLERDDIVSSITSQLSVSETFVDTLDANFYQQIIDDSTKMTEAFDELQKVVPYFKSDMLQAFNISIDYIDADGD